MLIKTASLTPESLSILRDKGTDMPHIGRLEELDEAGTYLCRQCGIALFRSSAKFNAHCGWPSFDQTIPGRVCEKLDQDGRRIEILCQQCDGHLGHVFLGEGFTDNNVRHCVNSTSLDFTPDTSVLDTAEGIFAGGCFWGLEDLFLKLSGVVLTEVGYTGGQFAHPTYEDVSSGKTGHVEAIRVVYDISRLDYTDIATYFFDIHDPTQQNGQGPDIGQQYLSMAFFYDESQREILNKIEEHAYGQGLFGGHKGKTGEHFLAS